MGPGFDGFVQLAQSRFVSAGQLEEQLPQPASDAQLRVFGDDRYLSMMCRRIFRAGLKHSMVDARWPQFEAAFHGFNPSAIASMSDEALESTMAQGGVIRHWSKIKAVRANAQLVLELAAASGSFGDWLADWPASDIVALWQLLKARGSQLGGNSGPYFLRMVGKDTFLLTEDVLQVLIAWGIVDKKPTSKKALAQVQAVFNGWQEESARPLCQISRIISYCA